MFKIANAPNPMLMHKGFDTQLLYKGETELIKKKYVRGKQKIVGCTKQPKLILHSIYLIIKCHVGHLFYVYFLTCILKRLNI